MLPVTSFSDFTVKVTGYDRGLVSLVVTVPADLLEQIPPFLNSLSSFFAHSRNRGRIAAAVSRVNDPVEIEKRQRSAAAYDALILKEFDKQISSGLNHRESFNAVKSSFSKRGLEITCYTVELIARKNGRLSKRRKP